MSTERSDETSQTPHRVILTKRSVGRISCRDFTRDIARCFTSFNMTENTQLCHIERM